MPGTIYAYTSMLFSRILDIENRLENNLLPVVERIRRLGSTQKHTFFFFREPDRGYTKTKLKKK